MRTDGLCEQCGKLQDKLAKLPLVPLNSHLRKHRDKVQMQLHRSARDGCMPKINLMAGTLD